MSIIFRALPIFFVERFAACNFEQKEKAGFSGILFLIGAPNHFFQKYRSGEGMNECKLLINGNWTVSGGDVVVL